MRLRSDWLRKRPSSGLWGTFSILPQLYHVSLSHSENQLANDTLDLNAPALVRIRHACTFPVVLKAETEYQKEDHADGCNVRDALVLDRDFVPHLTY